ncbi:MAG TPA: hypothetical protein VHB21_08860 [Minicystis sp.]|nr:hypothetical protein [Minicystis sp.]
MGWKETNRAAHEAFKAAALARTDAEAAEHEARFHELVAQAATEIPRDAMRYVPRSEDELVLAYPWETVLEAWRRRGVELARIRSAAVTLGGAR